MIRCLIIDDEPLAQDVIESYVQRVRFLELVAKVDNTLDALEIVQKEDVQLIFCDIQMPGITGIEFVKSLKPAPHVIFTTAFHEYALEGFNVEAIDFLLKPVVFDRFLRAVNKVKKFVDTGLQTAAPKPENDGHLFVKEDYKLVKINYNDIYYIEGMKDYAKIFTVQKTIITHVTLKKLEELLPAEDFFRTHKSFIIRLAVIRSVYGNMIESTNGSKIPIGLQYRDQLLSKIKSIN